jgi:hypothetical protein
VTLLPDEQIIEKTPLILTNYRIRFESKDMLRSMMLEDLSFCKVDLEANTWALAAAIIAAIAAAGLLLNRVEGGGAVAAMLAVLLGLYYIISRKTFLVVASSGGRIVYELQGQSRDMAGSFVDQAEAAKHARLLVLRGRC